MAYIGSTPTAVPLTGADIEDGTVQIADLAATGTKDATTFLRGDGTFAAAGGGVNTPAFHTTLSVGYSVTDNVLFKVNFDTEVFDTDGCYDNSTNYRFTPTSAGKYYCYSSLTLYGSGNSTLDRSELRIRKNGSDQYTVLNEFKTNPIKFHTIFGGEVIEFNGSTDYIEVYGLIDSVSGTPSVYSSAPFTSTFGAYKIIE